MGGKRGSYGSYLQGDCEPKAKVPRQTIWNKRKREQCIKDIVIPSKQEYQSNEKSLVNISIVTNNESHLIELDESNVTAMQNETNISIVANDSINSLNSASFDDMRNEPHEESSTELSSDF